MRRPCPVTPGPNPFEGLDAPPASATEPAERRARKPVWPVWAATAIAAAILVALGIGVWSKFASKPQAQPEPAPVANVAPPKPAPVGVEVPMFNGKELSGLDFHKNVWKIDTMGQLVANNATIYQMNAYTHPRKYTNFRWSFQIRLPANQVQTACFRFRSPLDKVGGKPEDIDKVWLALNSKVGFELRGTGAARALADINKDEFNSVSIEVVGEQVTVLVNGQKVLGEKITMPPDGVVAWSVAKDGYYFVRDVKFIDLGP